MRGMAGTFQLPRRCATFPSSDSGSKHCERGFAGVRPEGTSVRNRSTAVAGGNGRASELIGLERHRHPAYRGMMLLTVVDESPWIGQLTAVVTLVLTCRQPSRFIPELALLQRQLVRDIILINIGDVGDRLLSNVF